MKKGQFCKRGTNIDIDKCLESVLAEGGAAGRQYTSAQIEGMGRTQLPLHLFSSALNCNNRITCESHDKYPVDLLELRMSDMHLKCDVFQMSLCYFSFSKIND